MTKFIGFLLAFLLILGVSASAGNSTSYYHYGYDSITYLLDAPFTNDTVGSNSYLFDSANNDNIDVADAANLSPTSGFSICAWIKMSDITTCGIMGKLDAGAGAKEYQFHINNSDRIELYVYDTDDDYIRRYQAAALTTLEGKWIYACATWDGGTAHTDIDTFINCKEVDDTGTELNTFDGMTGGASNVDIGRANGAECDGNITKLFITSDVITNAECLSGMANSCSAMSIDNQVSCWDLDSDVNDDWGSNNGVAAGAPVAPDGTPDAPTDSWGLVDTQVLADTDGFSYIDDGSLTVVDTSTGVVEIDTNTLKMTGSAAIDTTGIYKTDSVARAIGTTMFVDLGMQTTAVLGWADGVPLKWAGNVDFGVYTAGANLNFYNAGSAEGSTWSTTNAQTWKFVLVLGGYKDDSSGEAYKDGDTKSSYEQGGALFIKGETQYSDWTLVWRTSNDNTTPLYAELLQHSAVQTTYDNFKVPDADLSSVLQPDNLSLCAGSVDFSSYTPDVGGTWTEHNGDSDTNSGVCENTTSGEATFDSTISDGIFDFTVDIPANDAGADCVDLLVRYTDADNTDRVRICDETAGNDLEYISEDSTVETSLAAADVDWVQNTAYVVRIILDGNNQHYVYVDGAAKISDTTAEASNTSATRVGFHDAGNAVYNFDNIGCWARTDATKYDAEFDKY